MITLRRATAEDVDWLLELLTHEDTEPFLGGQRALDRESIGWAAVAGLVLILTGVALGTARRRRVVPVQAALVAAPSEPT